MSKSRIIRVNELLKREIAEDLQSLYAMSDFDSAALTVTRVECAPDLRDANVFVSIFGHEDERDSMIAFLNRRRQDVVKKMVKRVKLKYTPRLQFKLDTSLEGGDNILSIIAEMEEENPELYKKGTDKKENNDGQE